MGKRSAEEQQPESQHIVKRSADADADADASPESWYYGYYGHPYRWGGYYRGYYGYGYPGYYCADHYIHTFLSGAIFKFKKSKFDDRNYCVNIHQNWDLSAKFFIKSSAIVLQLYYIQIVLPGEKISKIQFVILNLKKAKTLSQKLKEINCKNIRKKKKKKKKKNEKTPKKKKKKKKKKS